MGRTQLSLPLDEIASFCRRNHIRQLAIFGSALREDFHPDSDVDLLVEFEPGHVIGLRITEMEAELSRFFGGRQVDLVNRKYVNHRLRDRIFSTAEVLYAEG